MLDSYSKLCLKVQRALKRLLSFFYQVQPKVLLPYQISQPKVEKDEQFKITFSPVALKEACGAV